MNLSGIVKDALNALASSIDGVGALMRHGNHAGRIVFSSSREISGDVLSSDGPQEIRRAVALAADFRDLAQGSLVAVGGDWHIVTGVRSDPAGVTLSFGLSSSLAATKAVYARPGKGVMASLEILAVENATANNPSDLYAATNASTWTVAIHEETWLETVPPQIGDTLDIPDRKARLRISSVLHRDGFWALVARS